MTEDEVRELVRQKYHLNQDIDVVDIMACIKKAVEQEREACAQIADQYETDGSAVAHLIRARGEE